MTEKPMSLRTWNRMTPQERDSDRLLGAIPLGASWECETPRGKAAMKARDRQLSDPRFEDDCSCHINPPCGRCVRLEEVML